MTKWTVKYEGILVPVIITAATFREAVTQAMSVSDKIVSIEYLCY